MVSMQNALKPHPSSSYPDDDDEEDEGGDDNDDNRCNNTKQKEETADKTTEDQNASKTLKPPRPPQPSLSSSQTQPFSSSSSSSSVDHHTKITSFLPTPLTGTNSLSSPSSSLSPSSVLHQILSSTPPPIITPTYNEIKAKSLKQLKAIKKSRLNNNNNNNNNIIIIIFILVIIIIIQKFLMNNFCENILITVPNKTKIFLELYYWIKIQIKMRKKSNINRNKRTKIVYSPISLQTVKVPQGAGQDGSHPRQL